MKRGRALHFAATSMFLACAGVAACHLALDPDELVSGRSPDGALLPGADPDAGGGSTWWTGAIPSCVPRPSVATPLAAIGAPPGTLPATCPAGYVAEPTGRAYGRQDSGASCGANDCSCGDGTTTCTGGSVSIYRGAECRPDQQVSSGSSCLAHKATSGGRWVASTATAVVNCGGAASGSATVVKDESPFDLEVIFCRPDPKTPQCEEANTYGMPPIAANARACYLPDGGENDGCESPYAAFYFSPDPVVVDGHRCECQCTQSPDAGCVGAGIELYGDGGACPSGGGAALLETLTSGECHEVTAATTTFRAVGNATPSGRGCVPSTALTGTIYARQTFACCLDACTVCLGQQTEGSLPEQCEEAFADCLRDQACIQAYTCIAGTCPTRFTSCPECNTGNDEAFAAATEFLSCVYGDSIGAKCRDVCPELPR